MRKVRIAAILATAIVLIAIGAYLRDPALLKSAERTAASSTSGGKAATGDGGGATTEDWEGTGVTATALDPGKFSPGACMEFAPGGGPTRDETVFIDAGHGGIDPGGTGQTTSGATVTESVVNVAVAIDAMKVLTSAGYRVVLSRTRQTTVLKLAPDDTDGGLLSVTGVEQDLAARDICANDAHANLLVGIYMDGGSAGEEGSVTLYDAVRPFSSQSEHFANQLQADVLAKLNAAGYQIPDDGVHDDSGYGSTTSANGPAYGHLELLGPAYPSGGFTTPSEMPGALIEPLYLTDPFEATVAASSGGQELIAQGVANAVEQYFARS